MNEGLGRNEICGWLSLTLGTLNGGGRVVGGIVTGDRVSRGVVTGGSVSGRVVTGGGMPSGGAEFKVSG